MKTRRLIFSLLGAMGLLGSVAIAQSTSETPTDPSTEPPESAPDSTLPEPPPLPDALQEMIQYYKDQRHDLIAARQALVELLKTATEEERVAIMEEFRSEQKERLEAERELRKQMRLQLEEIRRQRRNADANG